MDPVTHAVIGMSLSKLTGHAISLSDAATVGLTIGSTFPDIDILLQKWGDYVYLKNHRGFTHSVPGLVASALLISLALKGFYPNTGITGIFIFTLLGCLSHSFFDILNSYGAKVLWPVYNKKISFGILIIFDPILVGILIGYLLGSGVHNNFIGAFIFYLCARSIMRFIVNYELRHVYGGTFNKISLLPSMTGLFRWHFILESEKYSLIGEKNVLNGKVKILKQLDKLNDAGIDYALSTHVGRFFADFTPYFHLSCEQSGGIKRYTFIDMRYLLNGKFLHHALLEVGENNNVIKASFNPYSMNRSCDIPVEKAD